MPRILPAIHGAAVPQAERAPQAPARFVTARTFSEVRNSTRDWAPPLSLLVPLGSSCGDHLHAHYDWVALCEWVREGSSDENRSAAIPLINKACRANTDALNLSSLPCKTLPPIPHGIRYIEAPRSLTRLSPPEGVQHVDARHCTALTEFALPESLRWLNLSCVPMKALPPLPDGLRHLAAIDCGLETLPSTWPRNIYVELGCNPVAVADPSLAGKWIMRSPADALPANVAAWFPPAQRSAVEADWSAFAGEPGAEAFSLFLRELIDSPLAAGFGFVESRRPWLVRLANDPAMRATMFAIRPDHLASGEDIEASLKSMDVATWVADVEAALELVERL